MQNVLLNKESSLQEISNRKPFRLHHLLLLLEAWDKQNFPLDRFLREHFRLHKAIGSKDRKWIAEKVYELIRQKRLVDALISGKASWEKRIEILETLKDRDISNLAASVQVSCPDFLFEILVKAYGVEKATEFCRISNERAPLTLRVNTLKCIREEFMDELKKTSSDFTLCEHRNALTLHANINLFAMPEFKAGKFEVQDEGSQYIADLVKASPNDWVLDYCAGAGGKSLAIAAQMKNRGQLFLHDIRKAALLEAKKRMNRAGVQNAQFVNADDVKKKKQLEAKMHWVLVDAPCSGTGTLRRNPDLKWKLTKEGLEELQILQAKIFSDAMKFLRPGGCIVYATCSVLPQENQDQVASFVKKFGLTLREEFLSLPQHAKMDGFYGAVLSS